MLLRGGRNTKQQTNQVREKRKEKRKGKMGARTNFVS